MKYLTRDKNIILEQSSSGGTTLLEGALLTDCVFFSCFQGSFASLSFSAALAGSIFCCFSTAGGDIFGIYV